MLRAANVVWALNYEQVLLSMATAKRLSNATDNQIRRRGRDRKRVHEFGHDCCLLKSWLLSTWPMASQFVMCAINYKAEKGTPIAKPKRAMKCAVTSNTELAAPAPWLNQTEPQKSSPMGVRVCACVCEWICMFATLAGESVRQAATILHCCCRQQQHKQHWR